MKVVKILLLLLSLLVYLGFFFYQNKRLPNLNDFKSSSSPQKVLGAFTFEDSSKIAKEQMGILSQKSTKVKKQIDKAIGSVITENTNNKEPVHQKALDYGKYIYCQEVVKDYESKK